MQFGWRRKKWLEARKEEIYEEGYTRMYSTNCDVQGCITGIRSLKGSHSFCYQFNRYNLQNEHRHAKLDLADSMLWIRFMVEC